MADFRNSLALIDEDLSLNPDAMGLADKCGRG